MSRELYTPEGGLQWPPADFYAVVGLVVAAQFVPALPPGNPVRVAIALPLVFFLPGYALLTVAFPHAAESQSRGHRQSITLVERLLLSVGLSIGCSSLVAILLTQVVPGFGVRQALTALSLAVLVLAVAGVGRRFALPQGDRFRFPLDRWVEETRRALFRAPEPGAVLSLALVATAAVTLGTLGYVTTQPLDGSATTSFELATEGEAGEYVAADYPSVLAEGERATLTFVVNNSEGESVRYRVVVAFERVGPGGSVSERTVLERFERRLDPGETWTERHTVAPPAPGDRTRLTYLLYEGQVPATPTTENAYRHLYLWLDSPDGSTSGNATVGNVTGRLAPPAVPGE